MSRYVVVLLKTKILHKRRSPIIRHRVIIHLSFVDYRSFIKLLSQSSVVLSPPLRVVVVNSLVST